MKQREVSQLAVIASNWINSLCTDRMLLDELEPI